MPNGDETERERPRFDRRQAHEDFLVDAFRAINRSFDLLAETLHATQQVQSAQTKQISDQQAEIRSIHQAIVGYDEGITHIPGLRDIVVQHIKSDEDLIARSKWVLRWVLLPVFCVLLLVPFLHALGLPTAMVGKALGFAASGNP